MEDNLIECLDKLSPISLEDMSSVKLMNRIDTKYLTTKNILIEILKKCTDSYYIQQIGDSRNALYNTTYFDTPLNDMYLAHQNGKLNRQKIRIRSYVDSDLNFLEVKTKNNKGRTKKKRVRITTNDIETETNLNFLRENTPFEPEVLERHLENRFYRITLVNYDKTERLTIDTNLFFHNLKTNADCYLKDLVIIELKRDGNSFSPIKNIITGFGLHTMGFSKYCVGSALTDKSLKQNRMKEKLRTMNKILKQPQ